MAPCSQDSVLGLDMGWSSLRVFPPPLYLAYRDFGLDRRHVPKWLPPNFNEYEGTSAFVFSRIEDQKLFLLTSIYIAFILLVCSQDSVFVAFSTSDFFPFFLCFFVANRIMVLWPRQ